VATKKERREKHSKKLFRLRKKREELQDELKDITAKIAREEEKVIDLFEVGHHTIGKLIVIVLKNVKKGRSNPAWKGIAEDMQLAVDEYKDFLIDEDDYDSKTANQFAKLMKGAYKRTTAKHTKKSEDQEVITVDIEKSS